MNIPKRLKNTAKYFLTGRLEDSEKIGFPPLTLEEAAELKAFFPMDKFFILGHARSGTTLLVRLIRLHETVHCNYQGHFFTHAPQISSLGDSTKMQNWKKPNNRWYRGEDRTAAALRSIMDFLMESDARRLGKTVVGDKSPNVHSDGKAVEEMAKFYPDGKLIYIVRDGRDTLVSHRFQNFINASHLLSKADNAIRARFIQNPEPFMNGEQSIFTRTAVERMSRGWVKNLKETHQRGQELYGENYFNLKYEEMVTSPYESISQVWNFLGVRSDGYEQAVENEMIQNPDAVYQKTQVVTAAANLQKGKRGSWKKMFTGRDKEVFKEIAGDTLIEWGYAEDNNW